MVETASSMIPLGTQAPDFSLPEPHSGQTRSLQTLRGECATVIMFICNHCPYVKHIAAELARLAQDYQPKGVAFIGINANDAGNYPEDAPDKMAEEVNKRGYTFAYLYDESQQVAKAYRAECTPDFFVFDKALACVYRGQLDDSRPGNSLPVSGKDLRLALDCILADNPVPTDQTPSVGCNIKWKNG